VTLDTFVFAYYLFRPKSGFLISINTIFSPNCGLAADPPFFLYSKETLSLLSEYLDEGNPSDASGYFIAWLCKKKEIQVFTMQGHRYDIGDEKSYHLVRKILGK